MEDKLKRLLKNLKMNETTISTILGIITLFIVVAMVVNFAKSNKNWWQNHKGEKKTTQISQQKENVQQGEQEQQSSSLPKKYVVKKGDYLWKIAKEVYGSGYNWIDIAKANKLKNPGVLYKGQTLILPNVPPRQISKKIDKQQQKTIKQVIKPISGDKYKVVKGDNLWSIAVRAYQDGYKWPEIAKVNKLKNPNVIEVGQVLKIPR